MVIFCPLFVVWIYNCVHDSEQPQPKIKIEFGKKVTSKQVPSLLHKIYGKSKRLSKYYIYYNIYIIKYDYIFFVTSCVYIYLKTINSKATRTNGRVWKDKWKLGKQKRLSEAYREVHCLVMERGVMYVRTKCIRSICLHGGDKFILRFFLFT